MGVATASRPSSTRRGGCARRRRNCSPTINASSGRWKARPRSSSATRRPRPSASPPRRMRGWRNWSRVADDDLGLAFHLPLLALIVGEHLLLLVPQPRLLDVVLHAAAAPLDRRDDHQACSP